MSEIASQFNNHGVCIRDNNKDNVIKVRLSLTLDVTHPRPGDQYKLLIFASRDIHNHSRLNKTVGLVNRVPSSVSFCLRVEPNVPTSMYFWLYDTNKHIKSGMLVQHMLAFTEILSKVLLTTTNISTPLLLHMKDTKGYPQAILSVQASPISPSLSFSSITSSETQQSRKTSDEFINQVQCAFDHYAWTKYQHFIDIQTPAGVLPLAAFPLLATLIQVPYEKAEKVMMALLVSACSHLSFIPSEVVECHDEIAAEIIAEMCTLMLRALVYVSDGTRINSTSDELIDQWIRLGSFPDFGLAGFDCEDGAEHILEVFHVIKYSKFNNPSLVRLQRLAKAYTPFLAIGKLKISDGYVPHAFVIVLDTRFARHLIEGDGLPAVSTVDRTFYPALAIEPTNYTQATWSASTMVHTVSKYTKTLKLLQQFDDPDDEKWNQILKIRTPVRVINSECLYDHISALITADYLNRVSGKTQVHHLLCVAGGNTHELGVTPQDLLRYDQYVQVQVAASCDAEALLPVLNALPPSELPGAYEEVKVDEYIEVGRMHVDIRKIDFIEYEKEIRKAAQKHAQAMGRSSFQIQTLQLGSTLELVTLHL